MLAVARYRARSRDVFSMRGRCANSNRKNDEAGMTIRNTEVQDMVWATRCGAVAECIT